MRLSLFTLCFGLVLCAAAAGQSSKPQTQKKTTPASRPTPSVQDGIGFARQGLVDEMGRPTSAGADARMNALGTAARDEGVVSPVAHKGPVSGVGQFTAKAYLRPRRLGVGQSGAIHVVVELSANFVVLAISTAKLVLETEQGPLHLGAVQRGAPSVGTVNTFFRGRSIFEDRLRFDLPVTIAAKAASGEYPVNGRVHLALHDSTTGISRGLFAVGIEGTVRVGAPLSNPDPKRSSEEPVEASGPTAKVGARTDGHPAAGSETDASTGGTAAGANLDPGSTQQSGSDPGNQRAHAGQWSWLISAAILAVIVLLLFSRRR